MAKAKFNIVRLQGKLGDHVFVNSATYCHHVRALRGTHKPATLNDSLKWNSSRTEALNDYGSAVFQVLMTYGKDCKQGQLWQKMLSGLRNTKNEAFETLPGCFRAMELNEKYPYSKLFPSRTTGEVLTGDKVITIYEDSGGHPLVHDIYDSYRWDCVLVQGNVEDGAVSFRHDVACTEWISVEDPYTAYEYSFERDRDATSFFYALIITGGKAGIRCRRRNINE